MLVPVTVSNAKLNITGFSLSKEITGLTFL